MSQVRVTRAQILRRSQRLRCPNCGRGALFQKRFLVHERCPHCGLRFARSDGFFLGAMVINYGVVVFGALPAVLVLLGLGWIGWKDAVALALCLALVLPVLLYRWSWATWLGVYYYFLPHELPANRTEAIPVREDE
ncbi:MAG: DUF983 domain-containing protein [Opitutales bacterium]